LRVRTRFKVKVREGDPGVASPALKGWISGFTGSRTRPAAKHAENTTTKWTIQRHKGSEQKEREGRGVRSGADQKDKQQER